MSDVFGIDSNFRDWSQLPDEKKQEIEDALKAFQEQLEAGDYTMLERNKLFDSKRARLIQDAKRDTETNGPEKWHDALTRYTELERELNRLQARVRHIEVALAARNILIPE